MKYCINEENIQLMVSYASLRSNKKGKQYSHFPAN